MEIKESIVPIEPPKYNAEINLETGTVIIECDDKNGKLSEEEVKRIIPKEN